VVLACKVRRLAVRRRPCSVTLPGHGLLFPYRIESDWERVAKRLGDPGRVTGELTALVGARVMEEHYHPALVDQFTVLEGALSIFEIWWTRGDSNPRPPRCERGALPAELLAHEQRSNFSKRPGRCQSAISPGYIKKGCSLLHPFA
jgi:hypothetical protein